MTEDQIITLIIIVLIALFLLYLAAGLVVIFTGFVLSLPPILYILLFILFPPTLIVVLIGLLFIALGFGRDRDTG